jgi:hypothetical protein
MAWAEGRLDWDRLKDVDRSVMTCYVDLLRRLRRLSPARPYLAWHLRQHVDLVRAAYAAELQLANAEVSAWLQGRIDALAELRASFVPTPIGLGSLLSSGQSGVKVASATLSTGALIIGIPAATAAVSATAIALIGSCFCEILYWTTWASLLAIGLAAYGLWLANRMITKTASNGQSCAELETELFRLLRTRRPLEPWPPIVASLALCTDGGLLFLARAVAAAGHLHHRSVPSALLASWSKWLALALVVLGPLSFPYWVRRYRKQQNPKRRKD